MTATRTDYQFETAAPLNRVPLDCDEILSETTTLEGSDEYIYERDF